MIIIVKNPVNGRRYKIEPMDSGLCFQIFKEPLSTDVSKNGKPIKSDWLSCEKYPTTIDHAINLCVEMMMLDKGHEELHLHISSTDLMHFGEGIRRAIQNLSWEVNAEAIKAKAQKDKEPPKPKKAAAKPKKKAVKNEQGQLDLK
jgi:hypothetical protein